jgi:hypothetical protein
VPISVDMITKSVADIAAGWAALTVHQQALRGLLRGHIVEDTITTAVIQIEDVRVEHGRVWLYGAPPTPRRWHRRTKKAIPLTHLPSLKFMTEREFREGRRLK